jgi:hypothetical protein
VTTPERPLLLARPLTPEHRILAANKQDSPAWAPCVLLYMIAILLARRRRTKGDARSASHHERVMQTCDRRDAQRLLMSRSHCV